MQSPSVIFSHGPALAAPKMCKRALSRLIQLRRRAEFLAFFISSNLTPGAPGRCRSSHGSRTSWPRASKSTTPCSWRKAPTSPGTAKLWQVPTHARWCNLASSETGEEQTHTIQAGVYGRPAIWTEDSVEYTHPEILAILATEEWSTPISIDPPQ